MVPIREKPKPGQESVWDYPRPAELQPIENHLRVSLGDMLVAQTRHGFRVIETCHPPTFYFPPGDVRLDLLSPIDHDSECSWKGHASYFDLDLDGFTIQCAAWTYLYPNEDFAGIKGYLAFYPAKLDCEIDGERARPQEGRVYAGWITSKVAGPFKGTPGSELW